MKSNRYGTRFTALVITVIAWTHVAGQSELKADFLLGSGGEYNIFKSPERLYSNTAGEYWDKDSLIISDLLFDMEYDVDFVKEKKDRYVFRTGSDLWYRYYLNHSELNQTRFNLYGDYRRVLARKVHLGLLYNFRWSDRVGTSVTGDLLMRSFKYLGNEGMLYLDILPSGNLNMRLFSNYRYKVYYDESTLDPLDHGNLELNYSLNLAIGRRHDLGLELSGIDRQYTSYHALDADGLYSRDYPLRHFRYYTAELSYDWKPVRGFRVSPEIKARRRIDMFEGYYSYLSYGGGMRIRYLWDKFYISLYGDYSRMTYDIRPAFTTLPDDPMLVYGYFDYRFNMRYKVFPQWEIGLELNSDNRDSNSDLDYFKTRRGYRNYEAILGIRYTLPVMNWK